MNRLSQRISRLFDALRNGPVTLVERAVDSPEVETTPPEDLKARKGRRWMVEIAPFVIMLPLFYIVAWNEAVSHNSGHQPGMEDPAIFYHDQHAYLNSGRMMRESGYQRVLPRHRMPGYSILLSAFYTDDLAYHPDLENNDHRRISEAYFERAKRFNILIAIIGVIVCYGICRAFIPVWESHLVTWTYAWLLAVIRAPYVQPEVVFYVIFLAAFVLLWRILVRPRWWMAGLAALMLATAFILKSTVLPLMALFVACALLRFGAMAWEARKAKNRGSFRESLKGIGTTAVVIAGFALLLMPYFSNTARLYGSALWDVHSRHYMWMENDAEKRFWRNAGIANAGFTPPPGKELPSARTYFATHDLSEIANRVCAGWKLSLNMIHQDYKALDRMLWRLILIPLVIFALLGHRRIRAAFSEHWASWLLILGFFMGYSLLYCWYAAIGVGPRLFLALYLPAVFIGMLSIRWLAAPWDLRAGRRSAPLGTVYFSVILIYLVFSSLDVIVKGI